MSENRLLAYLNRAFNSRELLAAATRRYPDGDLHDFAAFVDGVDWAQRKAGALPDFETMQYDAYLRSPEWRSRAARQLAEDGQRCRVCNSGEDLHVHHRTYANRGAEKPGDLVTLCGACHLSFHLDRELATA